MISGAMIERPLPRHLGNDRSFGGRCSRGNGVNRGMHRVIPIGAGAARGDRTRGTGGRRIERVAVPPKGVVRAAAP